MDFMRWYVTQVTLFFDSSSMSLTVSSLSISLSSKSTFKSSTYPGAVCLGFNGINECFQYSFWKILMSNKCKRARPVYFRFGTQWLKRVLNQTSCPGAYFISFPYTYLPFINRSFSTSIMRKHCLTLSCRRPVQSSKQTHMSWTKLRSTTFQMLNKMITTRSQSHTGTKSKKILHWIELN